MLIIVKSAAPLKRVWLDGTGEWRDGEDEVRPFFCNEYESRGMTMKFAEATSLRCIDSREAYYELS